MSHVLGSDTGELMHSQERSDRKKTSLRRSYIELYVSKQVD
jgi:hypothetical protein